MKDIKSLEQLANRNRRNIIQMIYNAKAGHPGGSLSVIDMLTAIYEIDVDFNSEKRSKVILSKGHAVPAQYAVLHSKGKIKDEELNSFRTVDSRLQGHPHTLDIPETDATTGLLGQGLSIAVGMAIVKKNNNEKNHVYAILGDGEMQEGQIWESLLQAAHYKLDNLIVVIDYNKLSSSGAVNEVINLEPLTEKLRVFDFYTIEIDGNNMQEIVNALNEAFTVKGKPIVIVSNTIKGKGVSFMENNPKWHSGALTEKEYEKAIEELDKAKEEII
ncbi:MAG: transketolase [Clostridia bacterium]|nr:transketolase [Clostridia bacterium]